MDSPFADRPERPPSTSSAVYGLKISSDVNVPDGTQVWMQGREVVDVTTDDRAKFFAMFGLMRIPTLHADGVLLSVADFASFKASAKDAWP
ncbi:MAG TPA: hypothetical protein VGN60_07745 [Devosia sp.]|jgi:hypothetical protein|nr:hypothetical protein [Devosia sp.]